MIKRCVNSERGTVLDYIGDNFPKCLYLFLNLTKYGCSSEMTSTWVITDNGRITAALLAYHTAIHIYSQDNDFNVPEICDFLLSAKPTMVNAAAETIRIIEPFLLKEGYLSEFGHVGEWFGDAVDFSGNVIRAREDDIPEIARMLYEDDNIGVSYKYEDLLQQIRERLAQGYVRSYVIRRNDKPIAHVGTGAEIQGVCTIAYTIVSPSFRGRGLAGQLYNQACGHLKKEGKRIFAVYYPESARAFHQKVGFADICECGKLFLNMKKG